VLIQSQSGLRELRSKQISEDLEGSGQNNNIRRINQAISVISLLPPPSTSRFSSVSLPTPLSPLQVSDENPT
jgi:hypothetical protein